jgi:hypothetical protein
MTTVNRTRLVIAAVLAVIAALVAFAVIHARGETLRIAPTGTPHAYAASAYAHPHPCPPRNKHCRPVKPPVPPAGCIWVIGSAIGDIPRCVLNG